MNRVNVVRNRRIADKILFVDGFTGNGKTMLAPIVGSLNRVELMRFNYHLENIIELLYLGAISDEVAVSLIRTWTDIDLYRSLMGRETNFRYSDLSGVFRNQQARRYIRRLFAPGDEEVLARVEREDPILLLTTHTSLVGYRQLYKALEERLCFIELVRHPLYLIKQTRTYMHHFDSDPRVFHQVFSHGDRELQWWTLGWEDLYIRSNPMDKAIFMIDKFFQWLEQLEQDLTTEERQRMIIVPFEHFVLDPQPFIKDFELLLGTTSGDATKKMMKKQRVPRKMYAEGIGLSIYKRFGWENPDKGATEADELLKRRQYVAEEASDAGLECMDRLSREYEDRYMEPGVISG
jgi:hypothetical protein